MIILAVRTDKPEAELYVYDGKRQLIGLKWEAHRQLAVTLLSKIDQALKSANMTRENVDGLLFFKGPGSFTGLRIGASVVNALAYAKKAPIVSAGGENWLNDGLVSLLDGGNDIVAAVEYDAPATTTKPKK